MERYYLSLLFVPKVQIQMLLLGTLWIVLLSCFIGIVAGGGFAIGVLIGFPVLFKLYIDFVLKLLPELTGKCLAVTKNSIMITYLNKTSVSINLEAIKKIKFQWPPVVSRRGRGAREVIIEQKDGEVVEIYYVYFDEVLLRLAELAKQNGIQTEGLDVTKTGYSYKYLHTFQMIGVWGAFAVVIYLLCKALKLF